MNNFIMLLQLNWFEVTTILIFILCFVGFIYQLLAVLNRAFVMKNEKVSAGEDLARIVVAEHNAWIEQQRVVYGIIRWSDDKPKSVEMAEIILNKT